VDIADVLAGYQRLVALAGSPHRVVPGHDPLVRGGYPALNAATQGIVHRMDVPRLDV
jgi:hypothetical protein